jgi:hypothetical protein
MTRIAEAPEGLSFYVAAKSTMTLGLVAADRRGWLFRESPFGMITDLGANPH